MHVAAPSRAAMAPASPTTPEASRTTPGRCARAILVLIVLFGTLLAGCTSPQPVDDRDPTPPVPGGTNQPAAIPEPLHFDGTRAYSRALAQIYDDPANQSGPRYRIPGSQTTDAVASELRTALADALEPLGGSATIEDFTGTEYYDLDLAPVRTYMCAENDDARDRVRGITFHNVIGRTDPDSVGLIIGAHYDSKRHGDSDPNPDHRDDPILGADDGAASTAAVVELARALAANPPGIALTFILFDGEDGFARDDCHPLAGSLHFAQALSDDVAAAAHGMILLDMIGNASATFYREANSKLYRSQDGMLDSSWLGDLVWDTAARLNESAFDDDAMPPIADDHLPFLYRGIPSLDIIRYERGFAPYWHTTQDDHTAIQPEGIHRVGRVVEASVHVLAARIDAP